MFKFLFIQGAAAVETVGGAAVNTAQKAAELNLIDLAFKGGWIMIPIVLLSFVAAYIFGERFWVIKKASKIDPSFMEQIKIKYTREKLMPH